jgi:hypothetical protein
MEGIEYFKTDLLLLVTFFELVDTSGCIHEHLLTGEERVRCVGYFKFYQRVLVTIFPADRFAGICGRLAEESLAVTHVLEHYYPVAFWMYFLFHIC